MNLLLLVILHLDARDPVFWLFVGVMLIILAAFIIFLFSSSTRVLRIQRQELKKIIEERTSKMMQLNASLQEKNDEISQQADELRAQKENLIESNLLLESKKLEVEQQKEELMKHRHHLEELVHERTRELEIAKEKAEESEKLKMAFLSNMSHEIRTPMNAVLGFASLLNESSLDAEEQIEYINQINRNGQFLMVLIDDIIDLSKLESNQIEIRKETFELHRFLKELYLNLKNATGISSSKVNFYLELPSDQRALFIFADKLRITQIVSNLLNNAIKFTEEGVVTLGLQFLEKNIVIYVRDTGIGISDENKHLIFDRFRKIENNLDKLYRGAGLGLTICKRLAEVLGGSLWMESEINKGSVFYFQLPYERPKNIPSSIIQLKDAAIKDQEMYFEGQTALVVEDDENNFAFLKELLRKRKFDVIWAKDGLEACNLFKNEQKFDVVLMDIKMPVMNGVDATQIIKEKFPDQVIIAQTAFAGISDWHKYRDLGFDGLVTKPIRSNELIHMISSLIRTGA